MTPGKEESDRDAMTASRLHGVEVPAAAGRPLVSPTVDARSRSPALALRFGLPGVAVASTIVGWVLFGDTDPTLWWGYFWPVRQLIAPAIAFSIGDAALLGYRKARWPAGLSPSARTRQQQAVCSPAATASASASASANRTWAGLASDLGHRLGSTDNDAQRVELAVRPHVVAGPRRPWRPNLGGSGALGQVIAIAPEHRMVVAIARCRRPTGRPTTTGCGPLVQRGDCACTRIGPAAALCAHC